MNRDGPGFRGMPLVTRKNRGGAARRLSAVDFRKSRQGRVSTTDIGKRGDLGGRTSKVLRTS